jgi:hypothetical protein
MLWRILAVGPLVVSVSSCNDANQAELSSLKARVEQLRNEANALKSSVATDIADLNQRIDRLETLSARADPIKNPPQPSVDVDAIKRVIADCVRTVHGLQPKTAVQSIGGSPYTEFDAYYNQGSGLVVNNNRYVDQGPTYAFDKCMATKGFPLK